MRETVIKFEYVETEYRVNCGDSDYIISGKVRLSDGVECVYAYIWELKAPQCYLFEKDTENRLRPTKELIAAENQLLNYHFEIKGNDSSKRKFGITHPDHIRIGGIIIGTRKTLVRGNFEINKKYKLYQMASHIRKQYFYNHLDIRLMTWDSILDHIYYQPIKGIRYGNIERLIHIPELTEKMEIREL